MSCHVDVNESRPGLIEAIHVGLGASSPLLEGKCYHLNLTVPGVLLPGCHRII